MTYKKFYNTSFRSDLGTLMSLAEFKKVYLQVLPPSADVEAIYKELGGKVVKKKSEKSEAKTD